jgi:hypothetical protein
MQLSAALSEVVAWASLNPLEFVLVYITDCEGDGCEGRSTVRLSRRQSPTCPWPGCRHG